MSARDIGPHLSDETLAGLDEAGTTAEAEISEHLRRCDACRLRGAELVEMRLLLAQTAAREVAPRRNVVGAAVKRLRLRRNSVTGANEFLSGLLALFRGLASLFSAGESRNADHRYRLPEDESRG